MTDKPKKEKTGMYDGLEGFVESMKIRKAESIIGLMKEVLYGQSGFGPVEDPKMLCEKFTAYLVKMNYKCSTKQDSGDQGFGGAYSGEDKGPDGAPPAASAALASVRNSR